MEKLKQTNSKCYYCDEIFIGGYEECCRHVESCYERHKEM